MAAFSTQKLRSAPRRVAPHRSAYRWARPGITWHCSGPARSRFRLSTRFHQRRSVQRHSAARAADFDVGHHAIQVRAMQSASRPSIVEHGHRLASTVGAGGPSFGGQRTVRSLRGTTVGGSSVRRAALIGCKPWRCVVSARQVGALGHQRALVFRREAQPGAQADSRRQAGVCRLAPLQGLPFLASVFLFTWFSVVCSREVLRCC